MPMQPSPSADTNSPDLPSSRVFIVSSTAHSFTITLAIASCETAQHDFSSVEPVNGYCSACPKPDRLINREGDDVVAPLERKVGVTAGADNDVLLAIHRVRSRRCVDTRARKKRPEDLAGRCVIGPEPTIALTRE